LMRKNSLTISGLMREAIQLYTPQMVSRVEQGQPK
jgi:hypothetical protein